LKRKSYPINPIGILGGTFDPIHFGHLRSALEVLQALQLSEIRFIPCREPPHREKPIALPEQRLALVEQAIADQAGFVVDDRELDREGPSYTRHTLASLREDMPDKSICLLLGMDAFLSLPTWYRWREIPELAHMIVMHRPGSELSFSQELTDLIVRYRCNDPQSLHKKIAGQLIFQPVTQLDISATQIRYLLAQGGSPRYLLPDTVWAYIHSQGLYRPEDDTLSRSIF
jgi:nicotinate-nucleotide adenylyltransferase